MSSRHRRRRSRARFGAITRLVVGVVLLIGVLFAAVFPTRTYLEQRRSISTAQERLDVLRGENDRMRDRIIALSTPSEVERIAREEYNLAKPGEEVYVIIPSEMEAVRRRGAAAEVVDAIRAGWGLPE